jgi:hypothetical protein
MLQKTMAADLDIFIGISLNEETPLQKRYANIRTPDYFTLMCFAQRYRNTIIGSIKVIVQLMMLTTVPIGYPLINIVQFGFLSQANACPYLLLLTVPTAAGFYR